MNKNFFFTVLTLSCFLFSYKNAQAQSPDSLELPPSTFALTLAHDNAFGLLPGVFGSLPLKKIDNNFTFYGLMWSNPGYAGTDGASDFWLESGIGWSRTFGGGTWLVNPSLGFTHGRLLSGAERGVFMDGMVPNVALFHFGEHWELEGYASYYKAFGRKNAISNDYSLAWLYAGHVLNERISFGLHTENFQATYVEDGLGENLYTWLGGYVKFTVQGKYSFRFVAGHNFEGNGAYGSDYYRLGVYALLSE